jgi:hypothetical protein
VQAIGVETASVVYGFVHAGRLGDRPAQLPVVLHNGETTEEAATHQWYGLLLLDESPGPATVVIESADGGEHVYDIRPGVLAVWPATAGRALVRLGARAPRFPNDPNLNIALVVVVDEREEARTVEIPDTLPDKDAAELPRPASNCAAWTQCLEVELDDENPVPCEDTGEDHAAHLGTLVTDVRDNSNRRLLVVDDAVPVTLVDDLHCHLEHDQAFSVEDVVDASVGSDGVRFLAGSDPERFMQTRLWQHLLRQLRHFTGDSSTPWFPYDVSTNALTWNDVPKIHLDCKESDNEWTLLLCV